MLRGSREIVQEKAKDVSYGEPLLIKEKDGSITFAVGTGNNEIFPVANGFGHEIGLEISAERMIELRKNFKLLLKIMEQTKES